MKSTEVIVDYYSVIITQGQNFVMRANSQVCFFEQQASVTVNFDKCRDCIYEPKARYMGPKSYVAS